MSDKKKHHPKKGEENKWKFEHSEDNPQTPSTSANNKWEPGVSGLHIQTPSASSRNRSEFLGEDLSLPQNSHQPSDSFTAPTKIPPSIRLLLLKELSRDAEKKQKENVQKDVDVSIDEVSQRNLIHSNVGKEPLPDTRFLNYSREDYVNAWLDNIEKIESEGAEIDRFFYEPLYNNIERVNIYEESNNERVNIYEESNNERATYVAAPNIELPNQSSEAANDMSQHSSNNERAKCEVAPNIELPNQSSEAATDMSQHSSNNERAKCEVAPNIELPNQSSQAANDMSQHSSNNERAKCEVAPNIELPNQSSQAANDMSQHSSNNERAAKFKSAKKPKRNDKFEGALVRRMLELHSYEVDSDMTSTVYPCSGNNSRCDITTDESTRSAEIPSSSDSSVSSSDSTMIVFPREETDVSESSPLDLSINPVPNDVDQHTMAKMTLRDLLVAKKNVTKMFHLLNDEIKTRRIVRMRKQASKA